MNQDYIVLINAIEYTTFINTDEKLVLVNPISYATLIGEF